MIIKRIAALVLALGLTVAPALPAEAAEAPLAHSTTMTVSLNGLGVRLPAFALLDENGYATNYVSLRIMADVLSGTLAQFDVVWDGSVNLLSKTYYLHRNGAEGGTPFSGSLPYAKLEQTTMVDGEPLHMDAIVLTDPATGGGYTFYQLRELGAALGFEVDWMVSPNGDGYVSILTGDEFCNTCY